MAKAAKPKQVLKNKIAVVTGASEGIGKACAKAMLDAGATVVLVGRDEAKLKKICAEWGEAAIPFAADLTKKADRNRLIKNVLKKVPHIDIFQPNAGVYADGLLVNHTTKQIDNIIDLNVSALIITTRDALKHMIKRDTGHILVTGSMAAQFPTPCEPVYMPSKWAVDGLVQALQQTVPPSIRVTSLEPASTRTALSNDWSAERQAAEAGKTMAAETVAKAAMFALTAPADTAVYKVVMAPPSFRFHKIPFNNPHDPK